MDPKSSPYMSYRLKLGGYWGMHVGVLGQTFKEYSRTLVLGGCISPEKSSFSCSFPFLCFP